MSKPVNNTASVAHLPGRAVLRMAGKERFSFLQNLISQDMALAEAGRPLFTAFLTPQGKYLFDFFVVPDGETLLLDIEAERRDDFTARFGRYRLRADVQFEDTDLSVYAAWNGVVEHSGAYTDPRLAALGQRVITKTLSTNAEEKDYRNHRYSFGVAEGMHEIPVNDATLAEVNFDALNGISFTKGCYLGQELTARMHHRALVKRRYLPFRFEGVTPQLHRHILHNGFDIGHIRAVGDGVGIGLFHLEAVKPFLNGAAPLVADGVIYDVFVPDFLKQKID